MHKMTWKTATLWAAAMAMFCLQGWAQQAAKLEHFNASLVDKTKDPCVDFYQYACSKWQAAHPIPPDLARNSTSTPLFFWNQEVLRDAMEKAAANPNASGTERQIGAYWTSCMDNKAREAEGKTWLSEALKPVDEMKSKHDLARVLASMHMRFPAAYEPGDNQTAAPMFGFGPAQDLKNSSEVVVGIDQGGLGLPSRSFYLSTDGHSERIRAEYKAHVAKMFQLAGDSAQAAAKESDAVMAIETALAQAQMDAVSRRDPLQTYHKRSLAEIKAAMPDFDFAEYEKLVGVPQPPFYIVSAPKFLPALDEQIKTRPLSEWKSYLRWWTIHSAANFTTPEMEQANFDFYGKVLVGVQTMLPQWRRCVATADMELGEALGKEYVKVAFPPASKQKALQLVGEIRNALKEDIGQLTWMSDATKQQAIAKLNGMTEKIGYPDKWRDYSSVKIVADNYLENLEAANAFEMKRQLAKVNKPADKMDWLMTPQTIDAYNDPQNNTINFPAGILQPPLFDPNQPDAANFGAIGMVIGHEVIHGFDDQGRKFDAKGDLRDWWTAADAKAYDERGNCIANQYTHEVPGLGVKTNGRMTQGEDTADNGGIHLAMLALENLYKKEGKSLDTPGPDGITPRQRFYLSAAFIWCGNERPDAERLQIATNPHSLPQYRVDFPMSNSAEFARAFGCKVGKPMVHTPACRVW